MADTDDKGLQGDVGEREAGTQGESERHTSERGWWATEPDVGRVANGVPARVDRLRGLGNAVVPQVAYVAGRVVMQIAESL